MTFEKITVNGKERPKYPASVLPNVPPFQIPLLPPSTFHQENIF